MLDVAISPLLASGGTMASDLPKSARAGRPKYAESFQ